MHFSPVSVCFFVGVFTNKDYNFEKAWNEAILVIFYAFTDHCCKITIAAKNCPTRRGETGFHQTDPGCNRYGEVTASAGSKAPLPLWCPEGRFQNLLRKMKILICVHLKQNLESLMRNGWICWAYFIKKRDLGGTWQLQLFRYLVSVKWINNSNYSKIKSYKRAYFGSTQKESSYSTIAD